MNDRDDMLLEALSGLLDAKLKPVNDTVKSIDNRLRKVEIVIENEIKPQVQALYDVAAPVAERYDSVSKDINDMKNDISLLKQVVADHSDILKKIS